MELRGIDVSAYNTVTNYQEVAADGIEIAITVSYTHLTLPTILRV